jgi:uncharacterized phage-associated protein
MEEVKERGRAMEATKRRPDEVMRSGIRFTFDERKTAAAAGHLLKLADGRMPYMKLIKLMYLADRESLKEYNRPITGDKYVSMKLGPVLSETLRLIKSECPSAGPWETTVQKEGYDAVLKGEPEEACLSAAEIELLDKAWALYSQLDQWALSKLTHRALPEWKYPGKTAKEITPEDILKAVEKSEEQIEEVRQDAEEDAYFDHLFKR